MTPAGRSCSAPTARRGPAGARGSSARALRGGARRRHPAARPRHPHGDPAQARPPRRHRARRRRGARADRRASTLNVRALEGALIRVVAFSSLTGRPLTGRARRGGPRRPLPREQRHRRRGRTIDRRDPGGRLRALRDLSRTSSSPPPRTARDRMAAAGRDVPRPRAHRRVAARDRPTVRRSRPHHRPPRMAADDCANRRRRATRARLWRSCAASSAASHSADHNPHAPTASPERLPTVYPQPHSTIAADRSASIAEPTIHILHSPY